MDAKANMPIGPWGRIVHRFRAGTSADLVSIRWPQRWGPGGYSAGTGGIIRISVHHNGPGDTPADMITSMLYLPGNPDSGSQFLRHTFAEPAPLLAGELYHIVFENVHSDPLNNYMSINNALNWEVDSPRQPMFGNLDYAVLSGRHGADTLEEHYTAIMDLSYSDGHNDGQGYIQAMRDKLAYVGGSNKVRQTITPTEDRTFQTVALRILRDSGSGSLTVSLAGQSVSIPSSSILLGDETNGWEPSGHWVTATFPSPVSLRNGTFYSLTLSAPSGTIYSVIPVREGYDSGPYGGSGHSTGFRSYTFRDGEVQKSTDGGATWVDLYAWSPVDMQFYLSPPSSAERLPCFVCK